MKINWKMVWEAIKEPLREFVIAIIPAALAFTQTLDWQYAGVIYFVLRFIDKYLHEAGKKKGNEALSRGITRF
jgi:hypothetical protein